MDSEVSLLKKKIKTLQKQLCDRTRNYLYHFKKSPNKTSHSTADQSTQTETVEDQSIEDTTQTQIIPQDQTFAHVHIDNFSKDSPLNQKFQQNKQIPDEKAQIQQPKKLKSILPLDLDTKEINSQLVQKNEKQKGEIDTLALEIKLMKEQLENSKTPRNKQQIKFEFLQTNSLLHTPSKQSNSNMEFSKKRDCDTIEEETDIKSNAESHQKMIEYDHLSKEVKIMKKEIKKLKASLEHQVQASAQTKAALLISEEENYKFRLKIQRLNKEIQILTGASTDSDVERYERPLIFESEEPALSSVDSEKSESTKEELEKFRSHAEKYEEHIFILEGVKRDYLKKCIQAKEEIYKLKQENEKLKVQINGVVASSKMRAINEKYANEGKQQQQDQQWRIPQEIKQKIHEISNCLPLTAKNQQIFMFRPDTTEDLTNMLQRILDFCRNIEFWERQKIQSIQKERANLLKVISGVLMRHPQTKQALTEEILQIHQLKYLVNFLNREPKQNINNTNISRIFTNNFTTEEINASEQQSIRTN